MPIPKTPNPDYVWFLYVELPETPEDVAKPIERWLYARSPLARWAVIKAEELTEDLGRCPDAVVVFWWPSNKDQEAVKLSSALESISRKPKVLILREFSAGQTSGMSGQFAERYPPVSVLDHLTGKQIREALDKLGVLPRLEDFKLVLNNASTDPALFKFIETIDPNVLLRLIAWHFPKAKWVRVLPVEGGWSGTPLCRFYVDDDPQEYFLKLHRDARDYVAEFSGHRKAESWLAKEGPEGQVERRAVELVSVDQALEDPNDAQKRIFSGGGYSLWPVCYKSASEETKRRETWQWLFSRRDSKFQLDVLDTLLETLAFQNDSPTYQPKLLWELPKASDPQAAVDPDQRLVLTLDMRIALEEALNDLEPYGQMMCQAATDGSNWDSRKEELSRLVDEHLPKELQGGPRYVALGHIHGDPNPRNCMVKAGDPNDPHDIGNPKDIQLIDCGNYLEEGRLVWDLAIIERDIKLVLMQVSSTDVCYKDLDANRLAGWCDLERRLTAKLAFVPRADTPLVEQLLARVRERAQQLSVGNGPVPLDPQGYHYFAALLYCTLDILKEPAVRRTKKLLALYSASEILRRFKKPNN
jgi:hypothetical protein